MSSILNQIFNQARPIQASSNQWMVPKEEESAKGWTRPIPPPLDDPFEVKPWTGATAPKPVATPPSRWLEHLYADLRARAHKGLDLMEQPDLPEDKIRTYGDRVQQLAWQMHLVELVVRELAPCPPTICPNRVGSGPGLHLDASYRERYIWDLRQAHGAGQVALQFKTPGGRTYTLVPWRSDPRAAGELDPLDMASLARVATLAGIDEPALLDLLPPKEVSNST